MDAASRLRQLVFSSPHIDPEYVLARLPPGALPEVSLPSAVQLPALCCCHHHHHHLHLYDCSWLLCHCVGIPLCVGTAVVTAAALPVEQVLLEYS
jgi:hypothetical protein